MTIAKTADINGTCLQGYVSATRTELEMIFGASYPGTDKTQYEYAGEIAGNIISVYDWKNEDVIWMNQEYQWNVGGFGKSAVSTLQATLIQIRKAAK